MTKEELKKHLLDLEGFDFEAFEFENEFSAKGILKAMDEYAQQAIAEHEASQWKKYPENKPKKAGWYLITDDEENIEADLWNNTDWANNPFVIAFRELPKPYQEERQSFGSLNGCHNCKHQDNDDVCKKCDDTWDKWEGGEK